MIIRWRQLQQWYIVTTLHHITPHTQATKVNIIIINIDDKIIQLLLIPKSLPLVSLPDLLCLRLCKLRVETKLKTDGLRFLCMTFIFFLFVDSDAMLIELAG